MLVQFAVENFLSFDEEQVLNLSATDGDSSHPSHVVSGDTSGSHLVLRAAAIYGPNASGKSNLVTAMRFARQLIVEGTKGKQRIRVRPFRLGADSSARPSKIEFIILRAGALYNYGFRVTSELVLEEWLIDTSGGNERLLFERTTSTDGVVAAEFGDTLTGGNGARGEFLQLVKTGTRPNQLLLTELRDRNVAEIAPVVDWFTSSLLLIPAETFVAELEATALRGEEFVTFLSRVARSSGTGIVEISYAQQPFDLERELRGVPSDKLDEVREAVAGLGPGEIVGFTAPDRGQCYVALGEDGNLVRTFLQTMHESGSGDPVSFELNAESDGTQRLMHLAPALLMLRNGPARTFVLDEIDRRFHPHLSQFILKTALERGEQQTDGQFIFTTHDTNLLDLETLRQDEIWFVEKDRGGASHVYSLAEFKLQPGMELGNGYLNGRFGAIPFISDIKSLGWREPSGKGAGAEETTTRQ